MQTPKKIIIAGGSGFLGKLIAARYYDTDTRIIILTRSPEPDDKNISFLKWDAKTIGPWVEEITGSDVVINLTGRSVDCRYNEKNKSVIINSRVNSTRVIGKAIGDCPNPPKLWINASTSAVYGDSGDEIMTEESKTAGGFSPGVCKIWERTFNEINTPGTRKCVLRIALVLGISGGVLKPFLKIARLGLGGKIGSGKQYISWIHDEDFVRAIDFIIGNDTIEGMMIVAGPEPVTNKEFMKTIRGTAGMPIGIPSPSFLVKIGAFILRTEPELLLMGRCVIPEYLIGKGFEFKYPFLGEALPEILTRKDKPSLFKRYKPGFSK